MDKYYLIKKQLRNDKIFDTYNKITYKTNKFSETFY